MLKNRFADSFIGKPYGLALVVSPATTWGEITTQFFLCMGSTSWIAPMALATNSTRNADLSVSLRDVKPGHPLIFLYARE